MCVVSSDGYRSNPSMRASSLTSSSTPDEASIGLHIESLELREKWAFTQALFELVCQQDASIDRALSNWLMPARAFHDLYLLTANELLGLVRGLQECNQLLVGASPSLQRSTILMTLGR